MKLLINKTDQLSLCKVNNTHIHIDHVERKVPKYKNHKLRERKVKTLTRNWRDHRRAGTHKHTETVSRYFDWHSRLSQSEESKCLWTQTFTRIHICYSYNLQNLYLIHLCQFSFIDPHILCNFFLLKVLRHFLIKKKESSFYSHNIKLAESIFPLFQDYMQWMKYFVIIIPYTKECTELTSKKSYSKNVLLYSLLVQLPTCYPCKFTLYVPSITWFYILIWIWCDAFYLGESRNSFHY